MSIKKIRYGNGTIQYTIVKTSRKKTSQIDVDDNGVIVRVPKTKKDSEIRKIVKEKSKWIFKKQLEFERRNKERKNLRYKTKLKNSYLEKRVQKLAAKIGVKPSKIIIKPLKNRWGSATEKGVVNLNSHLLKAPKDVIDYIIIHELCHLKIKNHSFRYWNLVSKFTPNYYTKIKWLEANSKFLL